MSVQGLGMGCHNVSPFSFHSHVPSPGTSLLKESLVDLLSVCRLSTGLMYQGQRQNCWAFSILHLLALLGREQQCTSSQPGRLCCASYLASRQRAFTALRTTHAKG